jgi:gliding motility-associated-like protein
MQVTTAAATLGSPSYLASLPDSIRMSRAGAVEFQGGNLVGLRCHRYPSQPAGQVFGPIDSSKKQPIFTTEEPAMSLSFMAQRVDISHFLWQYQHHDGPSRRHPAFVARAKQWQVVRSCCLIIATTVALFFPIHAQNLVPNPSFETHSQIPCTYSRLNNCTGWYSPSAATPDAFTTLNDPSCFVHLPLSTYTCAVSDCPMGYEYPRTGNFCAGLFTFADYGTNNQTYREYVQAPLTEPLQPGIQYCVEFWVSAGDSMGRFCNNIGACLSQLPISTSVYDVLPAVPQINEPNMVRQYNGWYRIAGSFTPTTTLNFITIGNFYDQANTLYEWIPLVYNNSSYNLLEAYYFIDDISVVPNIAPTMTITGADTVCPGTTTTLTANGAVTYQWWALNAPGQILSQGSTFSPTIDSTTSFVLQGTNCDFSSLDTVTVHTFPRPIAILGPDRHHCLGDNISDTLRSTTVFPSMLWNDGSAANNLVVTAMGTYWLQIVDSHGCIYRDTILVNEIPLGLPQSPITLCAGDTLLLDVSTTLQNPIWIDTLPGNTFTITDQTSVWVQGIDSLGCVRHDTLAINHDPAIDLEWPLDTVFCDTGLLGTSLYPNIVSWEWSTGDSTPSIVVTASGTYHVTGFTAANCRYADTLTVTLDPIDADLGPDGPYCNANGILLQAPANAAFTIWSDGSNGPTLFADSPGWYSLQVRSQNGCTDEDSVHYIRCDSLPSFPNVFSPNGDGFNDAFALMFPLPVVPASFSLSVYDRWGSLAYTSADPGFSWDGTTRQGAAPESCYYWTCRYHLSGGGVVSQVGTVMLVR